jgi:hypothetical protein
VPTLPSKPSWETPITASREIVEAIADVADSAVDVATSVVRSARRRRSGGRVLRRSWRYVAAATLVAVAAFALVRRRSSRATASSATAAGRPGQSAVGSDGVGRSGAARTDGLVQEYGDDVLADAGVRQVGSSTID